MLALKLSGEFVPLRQERAFWSVHPPQDCEGTWETEVKGTWAKVGLKKPEKEEETFMERYRLNLPTFQSLVNTIGPLVAKANTLMRSSICPEKRIAIFLHRMAHGEEYHELANNYRVGTSTAHSIIHEILPIVCSLIRFAFFPSCSLFLASDCDTEGVSDCTGGVAAVDALADDVRIGVEQLSLNARLVG